MVLTAGCVSWHKFRDGIVQPFRAAHSPRNHELYRYGDPCAPDRRVWDEGEIGLYNTLEILLAARRTSDLAACSECPEQAARWRRFFDEQAARINADHFDDIQGCYGLGTQGVQLYAVLSGVAVGERRQAVLNYLSNDILVTRRGTWGTGWHATNMFFELLACEDMVEEAHALMTHAQVPSLGAFIRAGCTTIPEDWNIPCSSNIHSVFIGAGSWFYEGYAGIRADPEYPGFKRFVVRPQIPESGLDWIETRYNSIRGEIGVAWHRQGEDLELTVETPPNSIARVEVPTAGHACVTMCAGRVNAKGTVKARPVFEAYSGKATLRFPTSALRMRSTR